jgi:DNA-directed RNA polymerase specialized sigma24 family protein
MTATTRKVKKTKSSSLFQRIANKDQTAIKDCIETYGNFIWMLARKFTSSTEDAEAATQEIFLDIWRYAENTGNIQSAGKTLIGLIARRRLIKYLD